MKEEASDYLELETIKNLVRKYSQFINFPIYVWSSKVRHHSLGERCIKILSRNILWAHSQVFVQTETVEEPIEEEEEAEKEATEDEAEVEEEEEDKDKPKTKKVKKKNKKGVASQIYASTKSLAIFKLDCVWSLMHLLNLYSFCLGGEDRVGLGADERYQAHLAEAC